MTRLRLLEEEEVEIKQAISVGGEREDLAVALRMVEMKRAMLPTTRQQEANLPLYT